MIPADLYKHFFWEYKPGVALEEIPGPIRAQRYVDYWPEVHEAFKRGEIDIGDMQAVVATIHRHGPVRYCEPVREHVIKALMKRWM